MDIDNYQKAWRAQSSRLRVTIDTNRLQDVAPDHQQPFRAMIFWQDCHAVGLGLLMLAVWGLLGVTSSFPWTWYLTVPALVWVAGFVLFNRLRRLQPKKPGEPLRVSVRGSLAQLEHQMWLLRNSFRWYLLPCLISFPVLCFQMARLQSIGWSKSLSSLLFVAVLYAIIYLLNELAIRMQLEPRRRELLTLFNDLKDEGDNMLFPRVIRPTSTKQPRVVWQQFVVASLCSVVITWIALAGGLSQSSDARLSGTANPANSLHMGLISELR